MQCAATLTFISLIVALHVVVVTLDTSFFFLIGTGPRVSPRCSTPAAERRHKWTQLIVPLELLHLRRRAKILTPLRWPRAGHAVIPWRARDGDAHHRAPRPGLAPRTKGELGGGVPLTLSALTHCKHCNNLPFHRFLDPIRSTLDCCSSCYIRLPRF
ncbi:hypothetical protein HDK77DRAFT_74620 [Phyllosticta capitalensis]